MGLHNGSRIRASASQTSRRTAGSRLSLLPGWPKAAGDRAQRSIRTPPSLSSRVPSSPGSSISGGRCPHPGERHKETALHSRRQLPTASGSLQLAAGEPLTRRLLEPLILWGRHTRSSLEPASGSPRPGARVSRGSRKAGQRSPGSQRVSGTPATPSGSGRAPSSGSGPSR